MKDWIDQNLFNLILSLLGGTSFLGYIVERRKRKIDERKESIDALRSMQEAYDKFTQDSFKLYSGISLEVTMLKEELKKVNRQLEEESLKYTKLKQKYEILLEDLNKMKSHTNPTK